MANVILRDGRVLQYNGAKSVRYGANGNMLELCGKNHDKTAYSIALIPIDIIERFE